MQSRSIDDLCAIASAGGSLVLHADVRPTDDLIRLAQSLQLTLQGTAFRPTEDLQLIAEVAPGQIIFVG
jgi:hypothetical protein